MQSGKYDQRVRIEASNRAADGGGGAAVTWTNVAEVWAAVWPISAREQFVAGQLSGVTAYRVRVRRRTDITTAHRLVWLTNGNQVMNIRGIPDVGPRADHVELLVDTGVPT